MKKIKKTIYITEETNAFLVDLEKKGFETPGRFLHYLAENYDSLKNQKEEVHQLSQQYRGMKKLVDEQTLQLNVLIDVVNTIMLAEDYGECVTLEQSKSVVLKEALEAAKKRKEAASIRSHTAYQTPETRRVETIE
ncbi:hypothetical protein ABFW39_002856 [Listeria monocytogenes]|uniref:Uncharacterized protein n=1 Tax=Listeria farberi TaxID=2713500 RepID=A0A7X1DFR0_9LIST|nr:hypothetical protein [Listeria farberi]EAC2247040.1 hypothetical protein [Listeria monocytogenes]MBC1250565.1 hypothetical protein [Listeria welshimeri]EAC4362778.1 hypothetical protein [Listeria monocytogenes]EAD4958556.1 hypothetical protein [Listeria monocytogenes]EAF5380707.1 hypothetical protein [Listeria monocytogenes]